VKIAQQNFVKWIDYFRIDIIMQLLEQAIDMKEP
jgi:hypothetical protein